MPLQQLRNSTFGRSKADLTGSGGVGYTLLNNDGTTNTSRTTMGVYQLASGSGCYGAYVTFPDNFRGQLLWDTGEPISTIAFATEQYNYEENNPKVDLIYDQLILVSGSVDFIKKIEGGRWKIANNQMYFYAEDNLTPVATFDLYDEVGTPTNDAVMERRRV